jgi:hypothetical protein
MCALFVRRTRLLVTRRMNVRTAASYNPSSNFAIVRAFSDASWFIGSTTNTLISVTIWFSRHLNEARP